jgi:ribosomal-protein-serine acetyltransferase
MNIILPVRENIELRTLKPSEAEIFFNVEKKNNIHLRKWLGWLDDDQSVTDVEKYIESSNKRLEENEGLDLAIWFENELIGGIGLFPLDIANKKTSIAYWLVEEHQGKGIMTDSLKVVIEHAFTLLKLNRIEVTCATQNERSSNIPKKLGFEFEGISRESGWLYDHFVDLEVYSLLSKEWKKQ